MGFFVTFVQAEAEKLTSRQNLFIHLFMYTLRKIFPDTVQQNIALGESYTLVTREQPGSGAEFNKAMAAHFQVKEVGEKLSEEQVKEGNSIYGFVFTENGVAWPLFEKCQHYIMTERGNTFANISCPK